MYFRKDLKIILPYILLFLFSIVLLSPLLIHPTLSAGVDSYFHFNQVYEDAMQIKHHVFSPFQSIFGFDQSGRIVNAVYSPVLSYLLGFLLLICGTWYRFEMVLFLITVNLGLIGAYLVTRKLCVRRSIGFLVSVVYVFSIPVSKWIGNQEFLGLGSLILPFGFLAALDMLKRGDVSRVGLALLMSLFIQVHFLTTFALCLDLVPAFLIALFRSQRPKIFWKHLLEAVGITVLLNLNVLESLYEIHLQKTVPPLPGFDFKQNAWRFSLTGLQGVGKLPTGIILFTMVIGGLYLLIRFWILVFRKHARKFNNYQTLAMLWLELTTVISFILSSRYFPWNLAIRHFPSIQDLIQFPMRFNPSFYLGALALLGLILNQVIQKVPRNYLLRTGSLGIALLVLVIGFYPIAKGTWGYYSWLPRVFYQANSKSAAYVDHYAFDFQYNTKNPRKLRQDWLASDSNAALTDVVKRIPDYLPIAKKVTPNNYYAGHHAIYRNLSREYQTPKLRCLKRPIQDGMIIEWAGQKRVTLPYAGYKHTRVTLNHRRVNYQRSSLGAIQLTGHQPLNRAVITYQPNPTWKVAIIIEIIGWLIAIYEFAARLIRNGD